MIYDFLSSNYPISLIILALVGAWAYRSRSSIRLAMMDDVPIWNAIARVAVGSTTLLFLWATLFDNWRLLLGYVIITGRDYAADPLEAGATPEMLRMVTLALLAVSLVTLALVYARHMGAYVFLIVTAIFAPIYMLTFNEIRISADVFLRLSELSLADPHPVDVASILFWSTGMFVIIATVVLAAFLTAFAFLALPARLIYGLFAAPKHEELARVFQSYERRARQSRAEQRHQTGSSTLNNDATANS